MRRWISLALAIILVALSVCNGKVTVNAAGLKAVQGTSGQENTGYNFLNKGLCKEFTIYDKKKLAKTITEFPKTLQVILEDGDVSEVKVSWKATEDPATTDRFYYVFVPTVQDKDDTVKELTGEDQPYIVVWIEPKGQAYEEDTPEVLGDLPGGSNEEKIFLFLKNQMGFNTAICCGILANIKAESAFNPNALGDKGTSYGICQWHNSKSDPRWEKLKNFCNNYGLDWHSLEGQLHYLSYELRTSFKSVLNNITHCENTADGAYLAGLIWCYYYEIPANKKSVSEYRGNVARDVYWPKYMGYVGNITYADIPEGKYYIRNLGTNQYVDLSGGLDVNGQNIGVFNFCGGPNQVMVFQKDGKGYAIRPSVSAGRVVKADNEYTYAGSNVCLKDFVNEDLTGSWRFQKVGEGNSYVIRNVQNQLCVWDISQSNLFVTNYTENNYCQLWALEPVADPLTGTVTINGDLVYGSTLKADVANCNNTGILSYQWRRDNVDIPGANQYGYMLTGEDVGKTISCRVYSTEQTGDLFGVATGLIRKGSGALAPTVTTNMIGRIGAKDGEIYNVTPAMEYTDKTDLTGWTACPDNKVTGLAAGTYYVRYKETDYVEAGSIAKVTIEETDQVTTLFQDVDKKEWYVKAVQNVYKQGLMNGMGNRQFAPEKALTRAECVMVLYNMSGKAPITNVKPTFADAPVGCWYANAVEWAYRNKITSGVSSNLFGAEMNITREQFVSMICRYAKYRKENVNESSNALKEYSDKNKVNDYAKESMNWAVSKKIITGKTAGKGKNLDPQGMTSRAECAQILSNYMEFIGK